ncbi:MAG: vWA domain-containing protein [Actinophytocola sp.]|uniref:vWA domain-containing protein n=1 Tax=Actinophytocola sp. TaxID=1872138 RepID=UPI003D6A176B
MATAQQSVPNPPWPSHCPLRLGLVVDQSDSMAAKFGEVREAASNVVDALRDKRSEISIIGFGTDAEVIRSDVDTSDDDARHQLKDQIDGLSAHDGDDSATNWEAALLAAKEFRLDVAVLVTDGFPNVYGSPPTQGEDQAIAAATAAANQLKQNGTRLTGVGIELDETGARNLESITGPGRGDDYFVTDTAGLLRQLYKIVASSCGVPLAALPQPEPPDFPWTEVVLGALGALALIGAVAYGPHRRRGAATTAPAPAGAGGAIAKDGRIDHSDLTRRLRGIRPDEQNTDATKDRP